MAKEVKYKFRVIWDGTRQQPCTSLTEAVYILKDLLKRHPSVTIEKIK